MFFSLFFIYFLDNPPDRSSYIARYPYVLSFRPGQIQQGGSTEIGFSSYRGTLDQSAIAKVINPGGKLFEGNKSILNSSLVYPEDFNGGNSNLPGNYTVAIVSRSDDSILISGSFGASVIPFLSSFGSFIFGNGIGLTIGVIGTIVTIAYQVVSQHNQDRSRRLDDRAKWMLENTKYYIALYGDSSSVCSAFVPKGETQPDYGKFDAKDVLFYTMKFYSDYLEFKKNCGYYYFDDYQTESFIAQLDDKLFRLFDEMTGDYSQLKQFFELKNQTEFMNHEHFAEYKDRVSLWLFDQEKARTYYLSHLVYKSVLLMSINKGLMVTYSSTSKIIKSVELSMEHDKDDIVSYINLLNKEFYGNNDELYYSLFSNGKGLKIRRNLAKIKALAENSGNSRLSQ